MRYASVCDGIGAVHVAWQPLGWECSWTAEIDAFPSAVVEQRWGFENRGDMTRFKEWDDADKEPNEVAAGELESGDAVQDHAVAVRQDAGAAGRRVRSLRVRDGKAGSGSRPCDGSGSGDTVSPVQCEAACGRGQRLDDAGLGVPVGHEKRFADVDVLVGGTPCQAFSVAGLRRSLEDERGNLSLVFVNLMDAIDEERKRLGKPPAICVWENVPGVLSTKDNAFGCFLAGLAGEDVPLQPPGGKWSNAGYVLGPKRAIAWRVLDAQYFGVAQRRRRVFLVASARDGFSPAQVLFESESVRRDNPPSRAKGQGVAAAASRGTGVSGEPIWRGGDQANSEHCIGHAGTLNCDKGQQGGIVAIPQAFYSTESRCDGIPEPDVSPPLKVGSNGGGQPPAVAFSAKDHGGDASEEVAPTMRSMGHDGSHANGGGQLALAVGTDLYNGAIDGEVAHSVRAGNGNAMGGVPSAMVQPFTKSKALTNPGDGGRSDAVNVVVPRPMAFTTEQTPKFSSDRALTITKQSPTGGGQPQCVMTPVPMVNMQGSKGNVVAQADGPSYTLNAANGHDVHAIATPMAVRRTDCLPSSGHGDTSNQGIGVMVQQGASDDRTRPRSDCAASAANGDCGGNSSSGRNIGKPVAYRVHSNNSTAMQGNGTARVADEVDVARSLDTCGGYAASQGGNIAMQAMAVRRLTPRECERLQGFPDDYTAIEYRKKPAADGPRYKALGNSMAVPVMAWIGRRINDVEGATA